MLHHHRRPVKNSSYLNKRSVCHGLTDEKSNQPLRALEPALVANSLSPSRAKRYDTRWGRKDGGKTVLGLLVCLSVARSVLSVMTNINCSVSVRPNYGRPY